MMMHRAEVSKEGPPNYGATMLVDTHTHAVSSDRERFPQRPATLANGAWWSDTDCSFEQLAAEVSASRVDRVVLVQAAGAYGGDNSYLLRALEQADSRFTGVGIIDPLTDLPTGPQLLALLARPGVGGLRLFYIPYPDTPWLAGEVGDGVINSCVANDLSISVCCQPEAFDELAAQLARQPDVSFVLDHCGFADFTGDPPYPQAAPLWRLAEYANLIVKFTPTLVRLNAADPRSLLAQLVARFGADRIIWGSDWPQHREVDEHGRQLTYSQQVDLVQEWMTDLHPNHQQAIAGGNALGLWPQLVAEPGAS